MISGTLEEGIVWNERMRREIGVSLRGISR